MQKPRGDVKGAGMWLKRYFQNLDVGTNRIKQSEAKKEVMAWQAQELSIILREREVICHSGSRKEGKGCRLDTEVTLEHPRHVLQFGV